MKTFAVTLIMMLAAAGAAHAGLFDKYSINREDLPEQAREMLDEHFPKAPRLTAARKPCPKRC